MASSVEFLLKMSMRFVELDKTFQARKVKKGFSLAFSEINLHNLHPQFRWRAFFGGKIENNLKNFNLRFRHFVFALPFSAYATALDLFF